MNEKEKSLKLAELMGWESYYTDFENNDLVWNCHPQFTTTQYTIEPYAKTDEGLAQFAAILLKFPEVMINLPHYNEGKPIIYRNKPTQPVILDKILEMSGVDV